MSFGELLAGKSVMRANSTDDGLGLWLDGECSLMIYNPCSILPASLKCTSLIGRTIESASSALGEFRLNLGGGVTLVVDLRDEAYTGPEPMVLRIPGQPIVVWN